jgi:hypothetical protein
MPQGQMAVAGGVVPWKQKRARLSQAVPRLRWAWALGRSRDGTDGGGDAEGDARGCSQVAPHVRDGLEGDVHKT